MALRNILNHCVHKLKPYRQFSSSTLISKNLYKSSLPILSTPWLMLPPDGKDGPNGPTDNYWNIIDKSMVKIDRPTAHGSVPFNTMCVGSAKGWVAFECDSDGSLFLANPYATETSCRKLPGPSPMYREGLHFTLAGDPMSKTFALLTEDRQDNVFEFGRQEGDPGKSWGHGVQIGNANGWHKQLGGVNSISRVAYNRKVNTVYKLHLEDSGNLQINVLCNGTKSRELSLFMDPKVITKYDELFKDSWNHNVEKFLVVTEEHNPSLFFVIRHLAKDDDVQCETKDIELFEIYLEGDGELKHVESIGDKALFLGRNSEPFFISTRECSGLKSNCVYVADDFGYYDLETKCLTPFLSFGDLAKIRPQAYWVAPPYFA